MKEKIQQFLNSIYFVIVINILGLLFWYFKVPLYSYLVYLVSFIFVIIFDARRIVVTALILNGLIAYRIVSTPEYENLYKSNLIIFSSLTAIAVAIVIYDLFFRRKIKFNFNNKIFFGMLAVFVSNILSIFNASQDTLFIIIMGILQAGSFLVILIFIDNLKDKESHIYFSKAAIVTGISITIQVFLHLMFENDDYEIWFFPIGWGNRNTISMMYMSLIPLSFYLYFKDQKNIAGLFFAGIFFTMTIIMLSRGTYVAIAILIIPFLVITYKGMQDKKKYINDLLKISLIGLVFGIIIIIAFQKQEYFLEHIQNKFVEEPFNPTGRENLYSIGFDVFKKYPIFGGGSFTGAYFLQTLNETSVATYHSYLIHALATTGLVGLITFIYYQYTIFKSLNLKHKFNLCVMFIILNFLIHGLFDNTFYNALFMIFLSLLLPLINPEDTHNNILVDEND